MKPLLKFTAFILLMGLLFDISCKKEYSCENCVGGNQPPIANAGPDQVITLPTDSVSLDGSASSDPDGTIVSYKWIKVSGPLSSNILKTDSSKTFVKTLVMGVYKFELTVKDNGGLTAKDTVQIIVNDPAHNQPPIANAGVDQTITLPTDSVLLNGNLSFDPDGIITSYKWLKISGPVSYNILNSDSTQSLLKTLVQGVYQFELTVKDNKGLTAKDTMQVMVNNSAVNQPPIACAGADQVITLPINSVNLNGSCSTDPENNITGYAWTKISGSSSFNIANANAVQTQVTDLVQGTYQFELKVTDAGGLFSKDTMEVTVVPTPPLNCDIANRPINDARFTSSIQLPEPRYGITFAANGNKIVIAGGYTSYSGGNPANFSDRVDIYDVNTGQWTITHLSEPRIVGAVAVLGNKIFFAGPTTTVDVYDVSSNKWSITQLSQARAGIAGGALDDKVFFAGGTIYIPISNGSFTQQLLDRVDIYNAVTNSSSTASLSEGRYCINDLEKITITVVGHNIFFAGGSCNTIQDCSSNRIDIYDAATNTWSNEIYTPKNGGSLFPGIAAGNKNYFVTGDYWQGGNLVEIRDEITHTTSYECLSGTLYKPPVKNGNKLIFPVSTVPRFTMSYKLTQFDVYDLSTNTWSISKLPSPGVDLPSPYMNVSNEFISVNNEVYAIDGYSTGTGFLYDKINKLEY